MVALLGWVSAALLVVTIGTQIARQYRERTNAGVSPWLYCGQCAASVGLLGYSALENDLVFVVLNAVMATTALVGLALWFRIRRGCRRASS